jgi:Zn-dependent M28 family amino/carboxypeptidase
VLAQTEIGPRPTGSDAGWATGDYISAELNKAGWSTESQEFIFKGVRGRNLIGRKIVGLEAQLSKEVIIVGTHYDTRPAADFDPDPTRRNSWIDGANDGASGVAVLLELARVLDTDQLDREVWLIFFDAEDRGRLGGWPFSVGARHLAEQLNVHPQSVVIVDMVGDADQNIYFERNSTKALNREIWATAAELGYADFFIPQVRHFVIDDHIPFLERAIPAVDIIDFNYPYWHTVEDTLDKVVPESLERVGRTLEVWLEKN